MLQRGRDSHYRAEAIINGTKVDVLVGTGSTDVTISQNWLMNSGLKVMLLYALKLQMVTA